jgi:hypothetical protein
VPLRSCPSECAKRRSRIEKGFTAAELLCGNEASRSFAKSGRARSGCRSGPGQPPRYRRRVGRRSRGRFVRPEPRRKSHRAPLAARRSHAGVQSSTPVRPVGLDGSSFPRNVSLPDRTDDRRGSRGKRPTSRWNLSRPDRGPTAPRSAKQAARRGDKCFPEQSQEGSVEAPAIGLVRRP